MAVGSYSPYNVKAELYNFGVGAWKTVENYPYAIGAGVYHYGMVFIPEKNSFFVIGGFTGEAGRDSISQIAKLNNGAWSSAGNLKSVRGVSFCLSLS